MEGLGLWALLPLSQCTGRDQLGWASSGMIMELIGAVDLELKGLELMDWPWWHYGDEHTFPFQQLLFSNVQTRFPLPVC